MTMVVERPDAESMLQDLADELEIPPGRYDDADRRYQSVGRWLSRGESRFAQTDVDVYTQGSFRLGTVIRPPNGDEHYDLDLVCEFRFGKLQLTQKELQDAFCAEMAAYAKAHNMDPPSPWNRGTTLNYAESAQFHMDALPAVPDQAARARLSERRVEARIAEKAVAITDSEHCNFRIKCDDWPVSNPNGYAAWFNARMQPALERQRRAMEAKARASVAQLPAYRVKTPLQSAVQILKHHRNVRFEEDKKGRPKSIVITTLATHAYQQESTIAQALLSILARMDQFVEHRGGDYWIPNPSDPRENFAEMWNQDPAQRDAFYDWLESARLDFRAAAQQGHVDEFVEVLAPRMGLRLMEATAKRRGARPSASRGLQLVRHASPVPIILRDAPHRRPMPWPYAPAGSVHLSGRCVKPGHMPQSLGSNAESLPKRTKLTFTAATDINIPVRFYWQIVNTGSQARDARSLRGSFEPEALPVRGHSTHNESTLYTGCHSIECFLVRDGVCIARSGQFIVNIQ